MTRGVSECRRYTGKATMLERDRHFMVGPVVDGKCTVRRPDGSTYEANAAFVLSVTIPCGEHATSPGDGG